MRQPALFLRALSDSSTSCRRLDVGVCRAPGIGKPGVEELGKLTALLVRKACVAAVGLRVLKVDFLVRHVKVAAGYDGLAGLALESRQKAAIGIVQAMRTSMRASSFWALGV